MSLSIQLFNGLDMPLIGWKVMSQDGTEKTEQILEEALLQPNLGCRLIDTSFEEKTEEIVGRVLKKLMNDNQLKREEMFVTAKLPAIGNHANRVEHFMKKSLENLQLDYVDLYLIESPVGFNYVDDDTFYPQTTDNQIDMDYHTDLVNVYKAMEVLVDKNLTKSIGLANFNARQLKLIMRNARIQPAHLQVECHAYMQQNELTQVCAKYQVTLGTFAPFGFSDKDQIAWTSLRNIDSLNKLSYRPTPLNDSTVRKLAIKNKMSSHQILLRFLIQNNIVTIVNLSTCLSTQEYFNKIFNFELPEKDFTMLLKLDKGAEARMFNLANVIKEFDAHAEYPFRDPF